MTLSKREQALQGLFLWLKQDLVNAQVCRNEPFPTKIPKGGLVIMRDGDAGEPEMTLSPPRYHYSHAVELEVMIQNSDPETRDQDLDQLLVQIGAILSEPITSYIQLSDHDDYLHVGTPEIMTDAPEGVSAIKAALVPVFLEYSTLNPLL
jgi:hypothetical protein